MHSVSGFPNNQKRNKCIRPNFFSFGNLEESFALVFEIVHQSIPARGSIAERKES